ncbi:unnamed protein product [Peniophora sp. CBMAI 1063]|nr:unnamed protein product [Peniophora sp. CBMAI 1063]
MPAKGPEEPLAVAQTLAPELLDIIFHFVEDEIVDLGEHRAPPCMPLSHVCRRWRTVALACRALWSTSLPRISQEWTDICLARCPSTPLNVYIDERNFWSESRRAAVASVMQDHWSWVKVLGLSLELPRTVTGRPDLSGACKLGLEAVLRFLTRPNDQLEVLLFDFGLEVGLGIDDWIPNDYKIPMDIFSSQPPCLLRDIRLVRCSLPRAPLPQLFTHSLRTLHLANTRAWRDVDNMIQYFRCMPMLETLTYKFFLEAYLFDCTPSRTHQASRCVSLPHLKSLDLEGHWIRNLSIINYIAIPSTCRITTQSIAWDHEEHYGPVPQNVVLDITAMCAESLQRHFSLATSRNIVYPIVMIQDLAIVAERKSAKGAMPIAEGTELPAKLQLNLPFPDSSALNERAAFRAYLSQPVLTGAKHLYFKERPYKLCPDVFDGYVNVQLLTIAEYADAEAFTAGLRSRGASLFPSLRRVVFVQYIINSARPDVLREMALALRDTLGARAAFDCLELSLCLGVTEETENKIRAILGSERFVRSEWPTELGAILD